MNKNWTLLCIFLLLAGMGYGQSSKKKKKVKKKNKTEKLTPGFEQKSNSYAPFSPEEIKEVANPAKVKKSKKKKSAFESYNITMEQKVVEFGERMEANAKAKKKQMKDMKKPQYSDPSYFGHKRKPKIRKVKNRKYCKECGITH
jgi:hypothetical protein